VKQGFEEEFVKRNKELDRNGRMEQFTLIKTGENAFCIIGTFASEEALLAARPKMIEQLDTMRHTLEEISPDLGVTDPASGPVVYDWTAD
jgi:hypothetical protein